jgi:hypothetical protein
MSDIDLTSPEVKAAIDAAVNEAVAGLKDKNTELLGKIKKLQKDAAIDPADLAAVETERDQWKDKAVAAEKLAKKAATDAEAAIKRAEAAESSTTRLLADSALGEALGKAGITNPVHQKAVKAMFANDVQVVAEGDAKVAKIGDKTVVEALAEWAGSDEGKHFVTNSANGGGSQGGTGRNTPTNKGDFGGNRDERKAAIAAQFPELNS